MCENIIGETVKDLLINNTINFDEWLSIFVQVLLSLEKAQRNLEFTHFDLHTGNVMINSSKNISYDVHIDDITYSINKSKFTPVIIDFGLSSIKSENRNIGSYLFPKYGMLNYMVQGYDMYKFLCFSCFYAKDPKLLESILEIFQFYGKDIPYSIGIKGVQSSIKSFCMEGTYSNLAKYTPLMLAKWILNKYKVNNIKEKERNTLRTIKYSKSFKKYSHLFDTNDNEKEIENVLPHFNKSYVLSIYFISVFKKLDQKTRLESIKNILKNTKVKNILIDRDTNILNNVFTIRLPKQNKLKEHIDNVLSLNIKDDDINLKNKFTKKLENIIKYHKILKPYIHIYYIIVDLNIKEFTSWVNSFQKSDIFVFYNKNNVEVEKARRWSITIKNSI